MQSDFLTLTDEEYALLKAKLADPLVLKFLKASVEATKAAKVAEPCVGLVVDPNSAVKYAIGQAYHDGEISQATFLYNLATGE